MSGDLPFIPLVIVGAGRSGTNALRDALTHLPGFATWPCDEINPIWRHGNIRHPNDELTPAHATPQVRQYIRHAFCRIWREQNKPAVVVEKTCATSLRVPFVDAVLPEARYVFIIRDGIDVVASAQKRWKGDLEVDGPSYFLAKARYAPLRDLPIYGLSFVRSRLAMMLGRKKDLGSWGPRYAGMQAHAHKSLEERVARQWMACVERSSTAFDAMSESKVLRIHYEDFTANPAQTLGRITEFLGIEMDIEALHIAAGLVRGTSVGKGRKAGMLDPAIYDMLKATLRKHGYLN